MWQKGGINISSTAAITQPNTASALAVLYISCYVITTKIFTHFQPFINTDCKRSFGTYNKGSCFVPRPRSSTGVFPTDTAYGKAGVEGRLTERQNVEQGKLCFHCSHHGVVSAGNKTVLVATGGPYNARTLLGPWGLKVMTY